MFRIKVKKISNDFLNFKRLRPFFPNGKGSGDFLQSGRFRINGALKVGFSDPKNSFFPWFELNHSIILQRRLIRKIVIINEFALKKRQNSPCQTWQSGLAYSGDGGIEVFGRQG
jgi:hypothetical protein